MENNDIHIRVASEDDAEEILAIYAPYVIKTAITFEYEVPTLKEFRGRIRHTLQKYPYLVAVRDSEIIGYAYAGAFYGRGRHVLRAQRPVRQHDPAGPQAVPMPQRPCIRHAGQRQVHELQTGDHLCHADHEG